MPISILYGEMTQLYTYIIFLYSFLLQFITGYNSPLYNRTLFIHPVCNRCICWSQTVNPFFPPPLTPWEPLVCFPRTSLLSSPHLLSITDFRAQLVISSLPASVWQVSALLRDCLPTNHFYLPPAFLPVRSHAEYHLYARYY